ncbi:hypothetical protein [Mucilaginibacter sp. L3T2-6]|uniref:hypothetical protein n=1 Tax=Mucilaginibacter sp. L3T2-6 TaxID=3062491 RepID=UPI002674D5E8|nr:hypothetical protein [Mucilaginibacter sp. L3T2-6]MDO3643835.1 hypothetical protein [Mucilaginibacter sp. L3T2-6]
MQNTIPTPEYLSIVITLQTSFLKWVHSHKLVDGPESIQFWKDKPDIQKFNFGGLDGCQFKTPEQVNSFIVAFDKVMERHEIDRKHRYPLWYMLMFMESSYERQSMSNNIHNHLHEYANFLLNVIAYANEQIELFEKNPSYIKLDDTLTGEFFFAKRSLADTMPLDELIEHIPYDNKLLEVVRFFRIKVFDKELYFPQDVTLSITSTDYQKLLTTKNDHNVSLLEFPTNLTYQTLTFTIQTMLDAHKRANTPFYREIIAKNTSWHHLIESNSNQKKHHLSHRVSLARVGTLVTDYFNEYNVTKVKRKVGLFLFDYFALFRAFKLPGTVSYPEDHRLLRSFYIEQGMKEDYMLYLMKELGGK